MGIKGFVILLESPNPVNFLKRALLEESTKQLRSYYTNYDVQESFAINPCYK
jgi:hypothetical protein